MTEPRRSRRLLTRALTAVLVLGALGGGVAYTAVTVDRADRTAPTVAWGEPSATAAPPDPAAGVERGRASTPLSRLLLPVPDGYVLGADVKGYGNDAELTAEEAAALLKSTGEGTYGKKRRQYEQRIDELGIEGMAIRSYATARSDLHVEVSVLRMKDKKTVRGFFELRTELLDLLELRKGPKIPGHAKDAACHLGPRPEKPEDDEHGPSLQMMFCSAYDGGVMVTVTAAGAAPFDEKAVAGLVGKQLRHIESPGEYV